MYIIIVGCGKIGAYLAKLLDEENDVVIIDKNERSFDKLKDFNGIQIVGDGLDMDILKENGIERTDAIIIVTNNDNANIVMGQIAKKIFNVPKVIIRISDPEKEKICEIFGIETINIPQLFSDIVKNELKSEISYKYILENKELKLVEIKTKPFVNKKVEEIEANGELKIITIIRNNQVFIPDRNFLIEENDKIVGIVKNSSLNKFKNIIKL